MATIPPCRANNIQPQDPPLQIQPADKALSFKVHAKDNSFRLVVANTTEETLVFDTVAVSCNCLRVTLEPGSISPGNSLAFDAAVDTSKVGKQGASIELINRAQNRLVIARGDIIWEVVPPFTVEPRILSLNQVDPTKGREFTLTISTNGSDTIPPEQIVAESLSEQITIVRKQANMVHFLLKPGEQSIKQEGMIKVSVPSIAPHLQYQTKIKWTHAEDDFKLSPRRLFLGRIAAGETREVTLKLTVLDGTLALRVSKIEGTGNFIVSEWKENNWEEANAGKTRAIKVTLALEPVSDDHNLFAGNLSVELAAKNTPQKIRRSIPVAGLRRFDD